MISLCLGSQGQQQSSAGEPQAGAQAEGAEDAGGRGARQPAQPDRAGRQEETSKGRSPSWERETGLRLMSVSLWSTVQLTQRLKTVKRQMDEAEEEIERLEHSKKKLQREVDEQLEANEQLHMQLSALRNEMR